MIKPNEWILSPRYDLKYVKKTSVIPKLFISIIRRKNIHIEIRIKNETIRDIEINFLIPDKDIEPPYTNILCKQGSAEQIFLPDMTKLQWYWRILNLNY